MSNLRHDSVPRSSYNDRWKYDIFSFNFSLKKIIFPTPQENYFFQSKTAQKKDAPGWRIFWARASQSKLTMGEAEKASEIAQGHAGHHLLVVASFTHSAVCSVAHCTLLNMTYLWSVSPEDNGRAKSEEESMEKMKGKCNGKWDFFPGITVVSCSWADGRSLNQII